MSGRNIVHIELSAKDRSQMQDFYGGLFGWEHDDFPDMNYTTFRSGSVGGGFNPLGEMTKAGDVVVYIDSPDIDADLKAIAARGGKALLPKTRDPRHGLVRLLRGPIGQPHGVVQRDARQDVITLCS